MSILFVFASWLHGGIKKNDSIVTIIGRFIFWPFFILFDPESITKKTLDDTINTHNDEVAINLKKLIINADTYLNKEELIRLNNVIRYGNNQITTFHYSDTAVEALKKFWEDNIPPSIYNKYLDEQNILKDSEQIKFLDTPAVARKKSVDPIDLEKDEKTKWDISLSNEFIKSTKKIEKNKQRRILDAINIIKEKPIQTHGNTIKPLGGNHSGLWRYRIGQDRLVYYPDKKSKKIILIVFTTRGNVYNKALKN